MKLEFKIFPIGVDPEFAIYSRSLHFFRIWKSEWKMFGEDYYSDHSEAEKVLKNIELLNDLIPK